VKCDAVLCSDRNESETLVESRLQHAEDTRVASTPGLMRSAAGLPVPGAVSRYRLQLAACQRTAAGVDVDKHRFSPPSLTTILLPVTHLHQFSPNAGAWSLIDRQSVTYLDRVDNLIGILDLRLTACFYPRDAS